MAATVSARVDAETESATEGLHPSCCGMGAPLLAHRPGAAWVGC